MSFHRPFTNVLTGTCVAFLKQLPDIIQGSVVNLITLKMQLMYTRKQCFENSKVCVTDLEFRLPEWNELENVLKNTVVNEQVEINGWVSLDLNATQIQPYISFSNIQKEV